MNWIKKLKNLFFKEKSPLEVAEEKIENMGFAIVNKEILNDMRCVNLTTKYKGNGDWDSHNVDLIKFFANMAVLQVLNARMKQKDCKMDVVIQKHPDKEVAVVFTLRL